MPQNQKPACRHMMFKLQKIFKTDSQRQKEIFEPERGKIFICRGTRIKITSVFLLETMQARRKGSEIFQLLKNTTSLEFCIQKLIFRQIINFQTKEAESLVINRYILMRISQNIIQEKRKCS